MSRPPERVPRPVFEATTRPVFTVYRRYGMRGANLVYGENDEETRTQLQLELIDLGSLGFDLELDTFDPHVEPLLGTDEGKCYSFDRSSPPREISTELRAVERQLRLIDEAHRRGGEVMASAHTLTRMTPEQSLWVGRLAEERGADALKIVQFCANYEDVVESLASTALLKRELRIPFVMMAMGEYGKLTRIMAPLLGSMLVFARQDYAPGSFYDQPPIRAMKAFYGNADFRITKRAESFLPPELLARELASTQR